MANKKLSLEVHREWNFRREVVGKIAQELEEYALTHELGLRDERYLELQRAHEEAFARVHSYSLAHPELEEMWKVPPKGKSFRDGTAYIFVLLAISYVIFHVFGLVPAIIFFVLGIVL